MEKINLQEKAQTTGTVCIRRYVGGTLAEASAYFRTAKNIERIAMKTSGALRAYLEKKVADIRENGETILKAGYIGIALEQKNLIVSSANHGKNLIAQRLGGTNTYSMNVTHGDIGTGSTAPALTDTNLTTGTTRRAIETASVSNNIVTLRFFFADAVLANGTYYEFGTFVDGSATLGTGQLFNHALFSTAYVKATGEDTSIDVEFDIN